MLSLFPAFFGGQIMSEYTSSASVLCNHIQLVRGRGHAMFDWDERQEIQLKQPQKILDCIQTIIPVS